MGKRASTGDGPVEHLSNSSLDDSSNLRAKRQAEIKLQLLKKHYEDELSLLNETRVENILKNSGAREYFDRFKTRIALKDDIIKNLKEDLEFKTKELAELRDRCREAEKKSQEYLKAWKNAKKGQAFNISPASSIIHHSSMEHYTVPPPPPIEPPSIEEIIRMEPSSRFFGMDSSIPPPPDIDVSLEEILETSKRSFEQEKGQFLCQAYLSIDLDSSQDALDGIVELVKSKTSQGWRAFERSDFHVTLIRGHRAIHYHQIKPLVASIEDLCRHLKQSNLCLDTIRFLSNNEKTKQFLAITTRNNQSSSELSDFAALKRKLRDIVDRFADRVTEEDETEDTVPHCSIMYRDIQNGQNDDDLKEIQNLCNESICIVKVGTINLKIGKEVYSFKF